MTGTPRETRRPAIQSPSPSANGRTRPVKKHPHANLVGRPDADTVLLPKLTRPKQEVGRARARVPAKAPDEYTLPLDAEWLERPDAGPAAAPRRRTLISRVVLALILCGQAALTLRLSNTVFQNEALYLFAGHWELAHLLHGVPSQGDFITYLPGVPALYPELGAALVNIGGLTVARAFSLAEMLVVTACAYSLTRHLFNERVALCAAALFSVSEATILLGHLATIDATSLCLLAVGTWVVVRTASWPWRAYLLAAPLVALAVAVSYSTLLYLPAVALLAGLAAVPYFGRPAMSRTLIFGGVSVLMIAMAAALAGPQFTTAVESSLSSHGTVALTQILFDSGRWAGLTIALAAFGAAAFAVRARTEPGELIMPAGDRTRRTMLGACLAGTALIAPLDQLSLHSEDSLATMIAFGAFLAAPMAGVGMARLIGDHFRRPLAGVAVFALALTLGLGQAARYPGAWADTPQLVSWLARYLQPGAHYLVEDDDIPMYYLDNRPDAQPSQFTSTYYIGYRTAHGKLLTGTAGFLAAIKAGYFRVIIYDSTVTPTLDKVLAQALEAAPNYQLTAAFTGTANSVRTTCFVWTRI